MQGQKDWETRRPIQGTTAWGTNSSCLALALSLRCDGSHLPHQPEIGTNRYGQRSKQKAVWAKKLRTTIFNATIAEARERSFYAAFPAQMEQEIADELGPIDECSEEDEPPISNNLRTKEENEQELLDSLK